MDLHRSWRFDDEVAAEFDEHVRQNIPGYEEVVRLSVEATRQACEAADPIAEVGCATGYTLTLLERAGFSRLVGVDSSPSMLDRCGARRAQLVCSDRFPTAMGPFKAVLLNWTLHFVHPENRLVYLRDVAQGMTSDGILILTEKTAQSRFVERCYHEFKHAQGMSQADIAAKKRSLINVLQPLPYQWYVDALKTLGFTTEILWAQYGFVTFLAYHRPF